MIIDRTRRQKLTLDLQLTHRQLEYENIRLAEKCIRELEAEIATFTEDCPQC